MGRTSTARSNTNRAAWDEMFDANSHQPRKADLKAYKVNMSPFVGGHSQWRNKKSRSTLTPYRKGASRSTTPANKGRRFNSFDFDARAQGPGHFASSYSGALTPQPRRSRTAAINSRPARTSIRPRVVAKIKTRSVRSMPPMAAGKKANVEDPQHGDGSQGKLAITTTGSPDETAMDTDPPGSSSKGPNNPPARDPVSRASSNCPSPAKMMKKSPLRYPVSPMNRLAYSRSNLHTRSLPTLRAHTAPSSEDAKPGFIPRMESQDSEWFKAAEKRMKSFRKENTDIRRSFELKEKYLRESEEQRYKKERIKFQSRDEEFLAREKTFGTHAQKEYERLAKVEASKRAAQLRVLSVDKCFDRSALRARRAREMLETELRDFNQSLPSKEAIKAQEAAAFRAGLSILRATKAKKLGDAAMTKEHKRRQSPSMLCLRLSAHNLFSVPDNRPTMSNLISGLVELQKTDSMKGFHNMVKNQHDKESSPPVENPAHVVHDSGKEHVMRAMAFHTRKPRVMCALYQRSMRAELKNYWYLLGQTTCIQGSSPEFNVYFNFVHHKTAGLTSGDDPMNHLKSYSVPAMHDEGRIVRVRIYDLHEDGTIANVLGSTDVEVSSIQNAVDDVIQNRHYELQRAKSESEKLQVGLLQHLGGAKRLKQLKEKWVQLMFPVEYPESSDMTSKMEDQRVRISLHCRNVNPNEILEVSCLNLVHPYEVHEANCTHNPDGVQADAVSEQLVTHQQLYFIKEEGKEAFQLETNGADNIKDVLDMYT